MSKAGYDFYLNKCLLPITPEKLQVKINNANDTLTLINEGEINILKTPGLTEVEFECTIPQVKYPFAVYKSGFKGASYFLDYFEQLKVDKKPFQFIVSRTMPNGKVLFSTNMKVSLEDYEITEQADEGFDLTVKINLKQYRDYATKTVNIKIADSKPKATVQQARAGAPPAKKGYAVGDIVNFHGGTHYYTSYAGAKGYPARAGQARITLDPTCKRNGGAHPWHLIHTDDSSSNVYGWVDEGTFD